MNAESGIGHQSASPSKAGRILIRDVGTLGDRVCLSIRRRNVLGAPLSPLETGLGNKKGRMRRPFESSSR